MLPVNQIETITGLDFFSNVLDSFEEIIESNSVTASLLTDSEFNLDGNISDSSVRHYGIAENNIFTRESKINDIAQVGSS